MIFQFLVVLLCLSVDSVTCV